ncbi:B12-binding domain-containing radical SAM protein [Candidatus Magnetobacterium casense]|uniref:B12-binding domain-containing radical SAM protein n=1 Tax=Candidatus Magnetobacterium casense TaxID=1455061 RepID=UPI00069755F2|nr:radical SAM protein [Candidatus Magnetobacterium casensis]
MSRDFRVTFLNPPFLRRFSRSQRSPAVTKSATLYYPMWLSYAAATVAGAGFEIDLIDAPADNINIDAVTDRVRAFGPRLIVVDTSTPSIYNDAAMCVPLKKALPDSFIVMVGTHVSALARESLMLERAVDAVAVGEYDYTLRELAVALRQGTSPVEVKGLVLRDAGQDGEHGGGFTDTGRRPLIDNLDDLPFVSPMYRRFLNHRNYFNPNALYPMVTITTSRGCPFECIFCLYPQTMMGHRVRTRSIDNVIAEMRYIVKSFPEARAIFFEDDTFTVNTNRCRMLSEAIIREGLRISWSANARADLTYDTMAAMKAAGCRALCVGFESGSQLLLDGMKKRVSIEIMHRFMRDARRAGILVHGCFMVGLPAETTATMQETLALAKSLNPDTVQFYPVMVYPATVAYNWYKQEGLLQNQDFSAWLTPSGLHNTVIRTHALSSEQLVRFCDYARRQFYLRPSYIAYKLWQSLGSVHEFRRNLKSAKTFIRHLLRGSDV